VPDGLAAPDWARIWAQVEADEYAIRPARKPSGSAHYEAWNPQEQLHAEFASEGMSVAGRAEAGQAGPWARLVLKGYGHGQELQEALPPALVASGNRIEYRRGTLTEWYVNQRHGVEQGFTLAERPTGLGDQGPLRLELAIEGTLRGELSPDGQAVVLRDGSGGEWMRYSGLKAWDARHQELAAKLEASDGVIALVVEASEAVYPVTIDPLITLTETRRLDPLAVGVNWFGVSVSISGDTVVVGAPGKCDYTGAAYVFDRNQDGTNNWGQVQELAASDAAVNDSFGWSVSISGDTVVVGANGSTNSTGAVYVFDRNQGGANNWGQVKELAASDAAAGDQFGSWVSLSGDTVVVGAWAKNSGTGAAYVFDRNRGGTNNWGQVQELAASDAGREGGFGVSVSLSGDTVVVGAYTKNSAAGAAYVFDRNQGGTNNWGQVQELAASDAAAHDQFGYSVSISGDTVVVGANGKNSNTGAAYVFDRNQGGTNNWGWVKELAASDAAAGDDLGWSVSISGDTVVVGAPGKNSLTGAAYVFDRNQGGTNNWGQLEKLTASDAAANDIFGTSVSLSGDTVVVGAIPKNSLTGAAYVFDRNQGATNNWGQVQKLAASDAAVNDFFGFSVSLSGDTVVVGAFGKNQPCSSKFLPNPLTGAAYVFERNEGGANNWGQVTKLTASDAAVNDEFGYSVSISGDTVVVGAIGKTNLTGAAYVFDRNQDGTNNWGQVQELAASDATRFGRFGGSVSISGDTVVVGASWKNTAYVFERNQGGTNNWGQVTKLTASDAAAGDLFGISVSISGDTAVVGAYEKTNFPGAAYVFERNQGGTNNWGQVQELAASDAAVNHQFGYSVSISGDTVVVGAVGKTNLIGAAYVFDRNQDGTNNWGQVQELAASDAAVNDSFGWSVSISGDTVAVGAPLKNSNTGAYIFERNRGGTNNWGQVQELAASDAAAGDQFGVSVSISGDTVVVGAYRKNSNTGAAYVFDLAAPTTTTAPPNITCPSNIVTQPDPGKCTATVTFAPVAAGSGGITTVCTPPSGSAFPIGTNTVICTATDAASNSVSCHFTITVATVPPTITCPGNITVSTGAGRATCDQVASWTAPTATADCGAAAVMQTKGLPSGSAFPVGTNQIEYTATDTGGNSSKCSFTVTVVDTTPPTNTCPGNITVTNDPGKCTAFVTVPAPVTGDNCGVASVVNSFNGTANASGTYPLGTTTVTWTVTDIHSNSATCQMTVTVVDPNPAVSVAPATQSLYYGCTIQQITFTVSDPSAAYGDISDSVSYTFNGGPVNQGLPSWLTPVQATDDAHWYLKGTAGAPGTYVITLNFQDQCGKARSASATITVLPAPAAPANPAWFYTGPTFYWTPNTNSSTVTLLLTATLKSYVCPLGSDVRKATVSFGIRGSDGISITPINGAQNLPVGLVNPSDPTVGTAGANVQYNIGSAMVQNLNIAVTVSGFFTANDSRTDVPIAIAVPTPGGLIVGAGSIDNTNSSGYLRGAIMDTNNNTLTPNNFSFNVTYPKSLINPKGQVLIYDRSYYTTSGTLDTNLHTYLFKSSAISTLARTLGVVSNTATFGSKVVTMEVLPNNTLVCIEGNDLLTMTMTDYSPSGSTKRTLAIAVQRSAGGLWYSSNWNGTQTTEKQINSGNLSVQ
jgi:hypothetical protein